MPSLPLHKHLPPHCIPHEEITSQMPCRVGGSQGLISSGSLETPSYMLHHIWMLSFQIYCTWLRGGRGRDTMSSTPSKHTRGMGQALNREVDPSSPLNFCCVAPLVDCIQEESFWSISLEQAVKIISFAQYLPWCLPPTPPFQLSKFEIRGGGGNWKHS